MAEKKMWIQDELTCKPLDSYEKILSFIENPPSWRTLCIEIKPHSESMIRNMDINEDFGTTLVKSTTTFCHFNPETENIKRHDKKKLPKTLVCHDMANGYHDDSYIDGSGRHDAYTFYNWAAIDVFCYFSHHLVTIPPLGWINVGHAHGVQVIGTVITEWGKGAAFWDKVLSSEAEWQTFASALVAIAKTLKFDGWLLNVENKVSRPRELLRFVRVLHALLHQELPAALLLWYDSVTTAGHLLWQNGLNEHNKEFFEAADGLFTNYSWSVEDVRRSAAAAGARLTDLYVGVDVWGRNFHGGGQFNTRQAVEVAHRHGCSLAIFAPAWTHEALGDSVVHGPPLEPYDQFLLRDRALWGSLWPYLNTRLPSALPFQTSFCRGQGKKRRLHGEVIGPVPWYNLRHQQYQPNSAHGHHGYMLTSHENTLHLTNKKHLEHKGRRSAEHSRDRDDVTLSTITISADDQDDQNTADNTLKRKQNTLKDTVTLKTPKTEANEESDVTNKDNEKETTRVDSHAVERDNTNESVSRDRYSRKLFSLALVPHELQCLEPYFEDSFTGGSCLKVNPRDDVTSQHRVARLFHCEFTCERMIVCVVTKTLPGAEEQTLDVTLHVREQGRWVLVGRPVQEAPADQLGDPRCVFPVDESNVEFRRLQTYVLLNEPGAYVPVQNDYGWKVRYFDVVVGGVVTTISCQTGRPDGPILLGYLGLGRRTESDRT